MRNAVVRTCHPNICLLVSQGYFTHKLYTYYDFHRQDKPNCGKQCSRVDWKAVSRQNSSQLDAKVDFGEFPDGRPTRLCFAFEVSSKAGIYSTRLFTEEAVRLIRRSKAATSSRKTNGQQALIGPPAQALAFRRLWCQVTARIPPASHFSCTRPARNAGHSLVSQICKIFEGMAECPLSGRSSTTVSPAIQQPDQQHDTASRILNRCLLSRH